MRVIPVCLIFAFVAGCGAATTERPEPQTERKMEDFGSYLEFQKDLREGFEDGSYGDLNEREMELLIDNQRTLEHTLSGADSIDDLSENEKIEVYNAQEAINAIIRGNVENRPVCRRQVKTLGSNIRKTQCYTARQREQMLEHARHVMESVRTHSTLMPIKR